MKTAILGAGLTGLTLGYLLTQKGIDFEILEKKPECGGLMRTLQEDGFTFDYGGSHIIFSKDRKILDFMINFLKNNKIRNRRDTRILYEGHYVKYPFENGLSNLPRQDNFECLYQFIQNLVIKEKGLLKSPINMKDWFYYTFGSGIAEKYLIPYNEKIWKYPLEEMSPVWVERIPQPPVEDIIKSSLGIPTEGYTHQLFFYYPSLGGIQSLAKAIENPIKDKIITNFEVKSIKKEDGKWVVSNKKQELEFDKLISTIPLPELFKALDNIPPKVLEAVNNLRFNSLITVGIGINKPKINNFSWIYIPDKNILTHRISFPSNYSPYVVPEGASSILAEITYRNGDEISKMSNNEIIEKTVSDLDKLGIINKNDVILTTIHNFKYAYVIYDLNYKKTLEIIFDYLREIGIDSIGRFGSWEYANMDRIIEIVKDYAQRI